jgi:subtilisin family serine protease
VPKLQDTPHNRRRTDCPKAQDAPEYRRRTDWLTAALALCVALAALWPAGALAAPNPTGAPTGGRGGIIDAGGPGAIPGSYIVVFKNSAVKTKTAPVLTNNLADKANAKVDHRYTAALHGFAGKMSETAALRLSANPAVAYVAQNQTLKALDDQANPPSWGLDREDQRDLPLNNSYHYDTAASNVTAYVIDTGIRVTHQTFGGRAVWGTNTTGDGTNTDCNGHGTHVAGTIGGAEYGVAKGVHLVAVKVLNCSGSGTTAGVVAGIDWVTANHVSPAVANMSLGGGVDTTLDNAVRNSIAHGVTYAIASGNSNVDACNASPARVADAITVDASDSNDARASFSNFGTCTDIFAPGVNITSAWNTSDTATNTISGTSMATPHVTGTAALYLSANPNATPDTVQQALTANATLDHIGNAGIGSPNALLYSRFSAAGSPVVGNPGNLSGTLGTAVSRQLSATGGSQPYTWSATGLPTGLSIDASTGLISGTPTVVSVFTVTVTAHDAAGATGSTSFTWTIGVGVGCSSPGQKLSNPGFESGNSAWTTTAGVIGQWAGSGQSTHTGTWSAWLNGYGTTHTDTLSQTITIPAACTNSTLSFWLHIDSAETTTTTAFDRLTVQLGSTTLATYSNLNKATGYVQRSFNVGSFAGQTVTLKFTGTEDVSLQTSFVIDDTAITAG